MAKIRKSSGAPESNDWLAVDRQNIDIAVEDQTKKMAKYARLLGEVKQEVLVLKASLELIEAELDPKIRKNPDSYGIDSPTEAQVAKAIVRNTTYQEKLSELHKAQEKEHDLRAVVAALDDRRFMIMALVKLHESEYFA